MDFLYEPHIWIVNVQRFSLPVRNSPPENFPACHSTNVELEFGLLKKLQTTETICSGSLRETGDPREATQG
jgi:hypothetical protein